MKTWMFWDLWHLDQIQGAALQQGRAQWQPEGSFVDPLMKGVASWPTVYWDEVTGKWRMLYSADFLPTQLLVADSEDGVHWSPVDCSDVAIDKKLAPHHVFTLPSGSIGGVYLDPIAEDGYPFKAFGIQHGVPTIERALADSNHVFHDVAEAGKKQRYVVNELMLVSKDGLHWEIDYEANWGQSHWHPEPPVYGFYNPLTKKHTMTARPGHGDRRVVMQTSDDTRDWSDPELLLQPDPEDLSMVQFYGMPVVYYEGVFVGLLWMFYPESADRPKLYNHSVAFMDAQIAYSYDGVRFQRGKRDPLIARNEPGLPGSGMLEPSCVVTTDDEIRIYSSAGKHAHGTMGDFRGRSEGLTSIELHTLRKDGFMYVETVGGSAASMLSKPLVLQDETLTMNAQAPHGEVLVQVTDVRCRPLEGFTFDDCVPFCGQEALDWAVVWKEHSLSELVGKAIRLDFRFRHARIYAFRGDFHFLDAQDWHLLEDGHTIDTRWFDF